MLLKTRDGSYTAGAAPVSLQTSPSVSAMSRYHRQRALPLVAAALRLGHICQRCVLHSSSTAELLQCWLWDGCRCSVPQLGFGRAEDAVRLLHLRPAVAGVVHLQAVVQLVQVLLHLLDLLPGHVLQAKAHLVGMEGGKDGWMDRKMSTLSILKEVQPSAVGSNNWHGDEMMAS